MTSPTSSTDSQNENPSESTTPEAAAPPPALVAVSPRRRRLKIAGLTGLGGVVVLAVAMKAYPPLVGTIVDAVRAVVGPEPIAWLEDKVYGAKDSYEQWKNRDAAPTSYWGNPSAPACSAEPGSSACGGTPSDSPPVIPAGSVAPPTDAAFPPKPFTAPHPKVATQGDGTWLTVADPRDPNGPASMVKTLVHPDPKRSYSLVAIIAIDLKRVEMHAVPGYGEPKSNALAREKRPGLIPSEHFGDLLAAFNGGFQVTHGHFGMMVDGVTLVKAQPKGCVVAKYKDGSMKVAEWKTLEPDAEQLAFWRQTPPCLVEGGTLNPLANESNRNWGATVDGETIIRRSAFGLDATGTVAFYGMGDALSSYTLAKAMQLAGAVNVAQLDVNHIYPRFFLYDGATSGPPMITAPLAPVPMFKKDEYTVASEFRDFFYLRRKKPS
ncbi:MAG: hypothetical protein U0165_11900 [Polyangiaceae bacterium]